MHLAFGSWLWVLWSLLLVTGLVTSEFCATSSGGDLGSRLVRRYNLLQALAAGKQKQVSSPECTTVRLERLHFVFAGFREQSDLVVRAGHILTDAANSLMNLTSSGEMNFAAFQSECAGRTNPFMAGNPIVPAIFQSVSVTAGRSSVRLCFPLASNASNASCYYWHSSHNSSAIILRVGSILYPLNISDWWFEPLRSVEKIKSFLEANGGLDDFECPVTRQRQTLNNRSVNVVKFGVTARHWTEPYYDCHLQRSWVRTYSTPIVYVDTSNETIHLLGTLSVDVDLSNIDIDECSSMVTGDSSSARLQSPHVYNTHACPDISTKCRPVAGLGLQVGGYRCYCRAGYFKESNEDRVLNSTQHFFDGQDINFALANETFNDSVCQSFSQLLQRKQQLEAFVKSRFSCRPCPIGCSTCLSGSDVCVYESSVPLVACLLSVNLAVTLSLICLVIFVRHYRHKWVFRSASWKFLIVTIIGAVLPLVGISIGPVMSMFTNRLVSDYSCAIKPWSAYIGFALAYGSVLLKTWRLSEIFSKRRFRGGGFKDLTNRHLGRLLTLIVLFFALVLGIWMVEARPVAITVYLTGSSGHPVSALKCSSTIIDSVMRLGTVLMLLPVIYLSNRLRNITVYSETKEIVAASYLSIVVSVVQVAVSQVRLGPDITFLALFIEMHLKFTGLIAFLFVPKLSRLWRQPSAAARPVELSQKLTLYSSQSNDGLHLEVYHSMSDLSRRSTRSPTTYCTRAGSLAYATQYSCSSKLFVCDRDSLTSSSLRRTVTITSRGTPSASDHSGRRRHVPYEYQKAVLDLTTTSVPEDGIRTRVQATDEEVRNMHRYRSHEKSKSLQVSIPSPLEQPVNNYCHSAGTSLPALSSSENFLGGHSHRLSSMSDLSHSDLFGRRYFPRRKPLTRRASSFNL